MKQLSARMLSALILIGALSLPALSADGIVVKKHVLSNGLTVLLHEDHTFPLVAVNLWYDVGARDEQKGRSGFAHLFEHYMFEGSKNVPNGEFDKITSRMGGYNNANTTQDRTDYFDVAPSENLEELLRLESDRMGFLKEAITQKSLDKQRGIVKNEKMVSYDNKPYGGMWPALDETAWPKGHPYQHATIGDMADLDRASLQDVQAFHDRYYRPENAILVVSGDQDCETTLKLVQKWFETLPPSEGASTPRAAVPPVPASFSKSRHEKTIADAKAQIPMVLMAYHIPGMRAEGSEVFSVLADVLGGGRTSRLEQSLRYDQRLATSIEAGVYGLQESDLLIIDAMPAPGVSPKQLVAAIKAEIRKLSSKGITPAELSREKAGLRTAKYAALQKVDEIAAALAEGQAVHGNPLAAEEQMEAVMNMQAQQVQAASKKYLVSSNSAIIYIMPKTGEPK